jgi:predicted porin
MNKKLGLAVAGALVAFASTANAGITIPAGDWTVDIGGNVNAYYTNVQSTTTTAAGVSADAADANTIGTGLLPAAFGIGAKTRQNDLDIAIQFSFFTGTSAGAGPLGSNAAAGNNSLNIRQAFLTFGDASWGTIKAGRDLGIFGSDAILSDMTLLGVGVGGPAGGSSTLGRIGSGYIYADWKGQMSYSSPNWNGFQVTGGLMEGFGNGREDLGYEAKATYDFAANDVTGRVWVSGITQESKVAGSAAIAANTYFTPISTTANVGNAAVAAVPASGYTSRGMDIGAKVAYQGFGLVGYYYNGDGLDSQNIGVGGLFNANGEKSKDSGGYVQATFAVPTIGTKLGASWGTSMSKGTTFDIENESWIVGAYHPLTKSLNLVAEYTQQEITNSKATGTAVKKTENDTISLGAILFF